MRPRWAAEPPSSSGCPSTGNPNSAQPRPGSRQASSSCDAAALRRSSIPGLGGGPTHVSDTVCHCLEQAVPGNQVAISTACSKQWHTVGRMSGVARNRVQAITSCARCTSANSSGAMRATVRPFRRPFPPCTTRAFPLPFGPSSFGSKKPANHQPSPDVQVSADHRRSRRVEPFGLRRIAVVGQQGRIRSSGDGPVERPDCKRRAACRARRSRRSTTPRRDGGVAAIGHRGCGGPGSADGGLAAERPVAMAAGNGAVPRHAGVSSPGGGAQRRRPSMPSGCRRPTTK